MTEQPLTNKSLPKTLNVFIFKNMVIPYILFTLNRYLILVL